MSIQSDKERAAELRRQLAETEARIREAQQRRVNEPPAGSKVYVTVTFPGNPNPYEYFALRADSDNRREPGANWYVTGRDGKITWEDFLHRIERGNIQIYPVQVALV